MICLECKKEFFGRKRKFCCEKCQKRFSNRKWKNNNPEKAKIIMKKWRTSEKGKNSMRKANKKWLENNRDINNERQKKWQKENRLICNKRQYNWVKKNKEKHNLKRKIELRTKSLLKKLEVKTSEQVCYICGETAQCVHHNDYKNVYNITWLCNRHHIQLHRFFPNNFNISED